MKQKRSNALARNLPPPAVLQHFWDLAQLGESIRLKAAHALLAHLHPLHNSFAAPPADANQDDLHAVLHPHVAYTLTRLVKGLPSSRLAARQGFTLALSLVIRLAYPTVQWKHIQALLQQHILSAPSDSNMDEREKLYGRMFVVVACIESGLPGVVSDEEEVKQMADHLMQVADKKAFLREAAYAAAFKLVATVSDQHRPAVLSTLTSYLPSDLVHVDHLTLSLFLDLAGVPNLPHTDLLTSAPIHDLLLHAASVAPRLHLVWSVLIAKLLDLSSPINLTSPSLARLPASTSLPLLAPIWSAIDAAFLASPLPQRQAAALAVFALLVRAVPAGELAALFTPHLVKVLDQAATLGDGSLLTPHAKRAMQAVAEVAVVDAKVVPVVLAAVKPATVAALLQQAAGDEENNKEQEDADEKAKSPVDQLLARLTDKDMDAFIQSLIERAEGAVAQLTADNSSTALDGLLNPALLTRPAAREQIATFLLSPAHRAHNPTQAASRILTFLARAFPTPESVAGSQALAQVYAVFPERHPKLSAWVAKGEPKDKHEAAIRALAMAGHLVLGTDAEADGLAVRAAEVVEEVVGVWTRMHPEEKKAGNKGKKKMQEQEEEEELHPLDVLADVALELTAHPMAWLRRVCAQVVGVFAGEMTENTLGLMVGALQGETGEEEDDEEDDDMDVDAEESDDEEEEVDEEDEDAMDVDEDSDADTDDDDDVAGAQAKADRNTQLSAAITNALRASGIAARDDADSDAESDLDDDQMLALDNVLGALVRKQNTRSATTDRLHFQYRVADLIGTYLKHRPAGATLTHLRLLADEIAETKDKQLAGKLWAALGNVKKIDVEGAEDGEVDAITLMFLKGDLAAAHGVLLKVFKAHPPSAQVTQVMLADLKRFKSILGGLAKTVPGACGEIMVEVVNRLSRKSVKQLGPVVAPMFERVHTTPELKTALEKVQAKFASVLVAEIKDNVKDTALLKLAVAGVRAWAKAGLDMQVWNESVVAKIDEAEVPTKQAPAALYREVVKLVSSPPAATAAVAEAAGPPTPRPTAAAARTAAVISAATPSGVNMDTPRPSKKAAAAATKKTAVTVASTPSGANMDTPRPTKKTAASKAQSAAVAKKLARTPELKVQEPLPGTLVPTPGTLSTPSAAAAAATPKASKQQQQQQGGKKAKGFASASASTPGSVAKGTPSKAKAAGKKAVTSASASVENEEGGEQGSSCVIA